MAITYTQNPLTTNNRNAKVWAVTCADLDTGPTVQAHGFGAVPFVWITQHICAALSPVWAVTADATNITLTKQGTAGSGGGVPGVTIVVTVVAIRPHSLLK